MATLLNDDVLIRDAHIYRQYLQHLSSRPGIDRIELLSAIPQSSFPSYGPLATFSAVIDAVPGPWPVLELQNIYTELWKLLPEDAKAGRAPAAVQQILDYANEQCKSAYSSLTDLYHPSSTAAAIIDPESGRSVRHQDLTTIVQNFRLPIVQTSLANRKPVIAISLPNGPLLALCVLATATYYTAAPVAHGNGVGRDQFRVDVLQSKSDMVLASAADVERLGLRDSWLAEAGIAVRLVALSDQMDLIVTDLDGAPLLSNDFSSARPIPNRADDTGIMLFTSGTSGTKKLVPLSIHSMVGGVAMVVKSWGLSPSMRCLNQMPLNHVGGLIRNLFAPIFSGGSVICCNAFDANLFWDCVEDLVPTWYYASPSMHQVILEAGSARPESVAKSQIRLICNAAGGLLPSLAIRLRTVFSTVNQECTVLPSYGMTECMPISTPPLTYKLEKTGTSGISVGPEIALLDGNDQVQKGTERVGRIAVRGAPVFGGYLKANDVIDQSCFTEDGWFDTGDMGYLDRDGYLYITGRSKEVINRGGELISPFEVEEAIVAAASKPQSPIFGRVSKALAFSVTHDVLQEVVGIAVVTPSGAHRADLRGIQEAVRSILSQAKLPVVVVYMDSGLPTNNNKILRIKLADRLGLPEIADSTPGAGRYFEATSPPNNTPLSTPIQCVPLQVSPLPLQHVCGTAVPRGFDFHITLDNFYPELVLAPQFGTSPNGFDTDRLVQLLSPELDGFNIPARVSLLGEPFPRTADDEIDEILMRKKLESQTKATVTRSTMSSTEATIAKVFAQTLSIPVGDVSGASDFFELGGDSMGAGRLLNLLRKEYPVRLPISALFTNPKVFQLAMHINDKLPSDQAREDEKATAISTTSTISVVDTQLLPGCEKTCSSTNPFVMFLELLPIGLFYPMKRALTYTIFIYMLTKTQDWVTNLSIPGRLVNLVFSIIVAGSITKIVAPLVGVTFKWLVIGRFREGLYPMWGSYHTRWWLVQKTTSICGMGVFSLSNWSKVVYCRLMGAQIGKNVTIQKGVILGEWDLITIENDVVLEKSIVRPFAAERNTTMYLGRIFIGANASIGLSSIVAPGTSVPANTCIGPNSSSWELSGAEEANRDLAASKVPGSHWLLIVFLGLPMQVIVRFAGAIPWLACLIALVTRAPMTAPDMLVEVLKWFSSPYRVAIHYAALAARVTLGPLFLYIAVLIFKRLMDLFCGGAIKPSSVDARSNMTKFRMQWLRSVMPAAQFHKATELFGTHYNMTSALARALGSKVGKRVYWPGTGPSIQDFDLLDIGDDVVFGSRSHLVTSDGTGSEYVRIRSGAMIADRVALLPGVEVGRKTVMGSGALTRRNVRYADRTTWVGAKDGDAVCLSVDTSHANSTALDSRSRSLTYSKDGAELSNMFGLDSTASTYEKGFLSVRVSSEKSRDSSKRPSLDIEKSSSSSYSDVADSKHPHVYETHLGSRSTMDTRQQTQQFSSTSSPFGRAFYEGRASYRVWGQFEIFLYSTLITIATGVLWNVPSVSTVQVVSWLYQSNNVVVQVFLANAWWRPLSLYTMFLALTMAMLATQAFFVLFFLIAAKWVLMGRRQPGNYDWDKSSYCQRWQLFLKLETLRRHCYGGQGILGMITGTHWIVMYFRALGASIGKDCALFAGGFPSLMFTEPDLLTLGDRVSVDDASLVGHINTRGKFDLNPLSVGARSVLRSGSRLLSGAKMEEDTCLLEHTLIMAGDVVDAGCTTQGWPAEDFSGNRLPTMEIVRNWKVKN